MIRIVLISLVVCITMITLTGCQESDSNLVQRARLVGNENLKLKNQLKEKDQEIALLKKDFENLEAEKALAIEEAGNANFKILQLLLESEQNKEKLIQKNAILKEELEKLKAQ
ncbi:MAG: hypothetical protein H8E62_07155 [Planctomycetes bacterium]|nr:hypothetical protein [Planctomycetota bacterium]